MAEQTNFGKSALITGVVLGVAAGAFGVYTMTSSKVDRPQTRLNVGANDKVAALARVADEVETTRKLDYSIKDVAPEGAEINGKPRYTPIFFSPELWQVWLSSEQKNTIIDIYDPTAQSIHGEVPNHWFISHGIADALGRSDGLTLDSDGDGFSNREEFEAETHPGDPSSLPSLIMVGKTPKIEVVSVKETSSVIAVDSTLAYEPNPTAVGIKIFARVGEKRPSARFTDLQVNGTFGLGGKDDDPARFTVLRFDRMDFTDASGNKQTETVVVVRDNVTADDEKEFFIRSGSPTRPTGNDYRSSNAKGRTVQDTVVTLRVTAGPEADKTFSVRLNGSFVVPGTNITCVLQSVDQSGSVNVLPQGTESPVNVPKAAN